MLNTGVRSATSADQREQEHLGALAALMVHVDMDHDSEQTVELAIALAERFQAALIGIAGCALWPAFMTGDVRLTNANQYDFQKVMARFEQRGKQFCARGRHLKQTEWRSVLESPGELLLREARAADLLIIGRRRSTGDYDPGTILLRAGAARSAGARHRPSARTPPRGRSLEGYA
jgi:nucleotide-binding universal stress UspA family protein